jgi:uncharacterized protein (TIGR00369 family)
MGQRRLHQVQEIFRRAAFIRDLKLKLSGVGKGWCETTLAPQKRHLQQHGYVHAGVLATMADHTAGGAARGAVRSGQDVITVEFKINFLRKAAGRLRCRSKVLRAGRSTVVCESDVYAQDSTTEQLVSKALVTLAIFPAAPPATARRGQGNSTRASAGDKSESGHND